MDTCFPDWNNQIGLEFPVPGHKKPFTSDNDLVELLWQNGELIMQSQTNKKPSYDTSNQQLHHKPDHQPSDNPIPNNETVPWADFPIDVCFDKELCSSFFPQIQSSDPAGVQKNPDTRVVIDHVVPRAQPHGFVAQPPPRFESSDARITTSSSKNLQKIPVERNTHKEGREQTIMTVGSSHCASNQVLTNDVDISWASSGNICSRTFNENCAKRMRPGHEVTERDTTLEQANTSSSNGSGSSFCKTNDRSNNDDTNRLKRKLKDVEESEQRSEATELESAAGNKSSQKSGTARKSRVAEVHNLSERRRRDRINEKMKALQELIPHSTKSDKASMLDEAIEYMKALQLQLQLLWMGSGMAPVMLPGVGLVGPQTLPAIQNLMRLSRLPLVDHALTTMNQAQMIQCQAQMFGPANYHNQMQNSTFPEQHAAANCMGFQGFQNSQQPMNTFNLGSVTAQQQNHIPAAPPGNGNGSIS